MKQSVESTEYLMMLLIRSILKCYCCRDSELKFVLHHFLLSVKHSGLSEFHLKSELFCQIFNWILCITKWLWSWYLIEKIFQTKIFDCFVECREQNIMELNSLSQLSEELQHYVSRRGKEELNWEDTEEYRGVQRRGRFRENTKTCASGATQL